MDDIVSEKDARALDPSTYYRHLTARNAGLVSTSVQQSIRNARVLIAGCGSIGGATVEPLARIGFTRLTIADTGTYELNNLNRQRAVLSDLGSAKATVAQKSVLSINPYAEVDVITEGITTENARQLVSGCDVIVDGVDVTTRSGLEAKVALHEAAQEFQRQLVTGWDMAGVLCAEHIDYRNTSKIFGGALTARDLDSLSIWEAISRLAPMSAMPTEMLDELASNLRNSEYSVPQLPEAAWQFGSLACQMVVRVIAGQPVPRRVRVDVHALTKPRRSRLLDLARRPLHTFRYAHALGLRGTLKVAAPRPFIKLL